MTKERKYSFNQKTISFLLVITILAVMFTGCSKTEELTAGFISSKLEPMSELVTAKLTYNGVILYRDGNVPFLTLKEFIMVYRAEVKASIDLSKVKIDISKSEVRIKLPDKVSLDINIDPESITFYAEKGALFNRESKEDTVSAIKAAEENVLEYAGIEELKSLAIEQATTLITGLVGEIIGDRALVVSS